MKSIEELAREFVHMLELRHGNGLRVIKDQPEFKALKSALDTPPALPPAEEYPKYYRSPDGNIFKFDAVTRGATRFFVANGLWGVCKNAWSLDEVTGEKFHGLPIPTAEALAIIEKSK